MKTHQNNRTFIRPERSNTYYLPEGVFESRTNNKSKQQQQQRKKVRYAQFDSVGRETSGFEETEHESGNHSNCPTCLKPRKLNSNLYTLREERLFGDTRHKK